MIKIIYSIRILKQLRKTATIQSAVAAEGAPASASASTSNAPSAFRVAIAQQQSSLRKSFRKVTFRRAGGSASDSWGAVWLNARRPSIRGELKLLQFKKNPITTFK